MGPGEGGDACLRTPSPRQVFVIRDDCHHAVLIVYRLRIRAPFTDFVTAEENPPQSCPPPPPFADLPVSVGLDPLVNLSYRV